MPVSTSARRLRKIRVGTVLSNRMMKTIVVRVDRLVRHPQYTRVIRRATAFKVHDEERSAQVGDLVKIMETRPLSKDKRWRLLEIVRRASSAPAIPETPSVKAPRPSIAQPTPQPKDQPA